jgi:hypothetical protein
VFWWVRGCESVCVCDKLIHACGNLDVRLLFLCGASVIVENCSEEICAVLSIHLL